MIFSPKPHISFLASPTASSSHLHLHLLTMSAALAKPFMGATLPSTRRAARAAPVSARALFSKTKAPAKVREK